MYGDKEYNEMMARMVVRIRKLEVAMSRDSKSEYVLVLGERSLREVKEWMSDQRLDYGSNRPFYMFFGCHVQIDNGET